MPLITEPFTAADNTTLNGFGGWSLHPISGSNLVIFSNKVTKDVSSSVALLMHSTLVSGDGYVQMPLTLMSSLSVNAAIVISLHPTNDDYVWLRHNNGNNEWSLRSTSGGSVTVLGTFTEALSPTDTRLARIERRFNAGNVEFRALIGGVERVGWTISNGHTGTRVGLRFSGAMSSTTGYSGDDFEAGVMVPTPPTNLILDAASPSQVNLTWTDNSNNEDSFRIERKTGVGGTYVEIGSNLADDSTYSDNTVVANTTYFYRVRARNNAGDSAYLAEQSVTTPASGGSAPTAPSALVLTAKSALQVDLLWTDNSNNETSFQIERKIGAGGTYVEIGSVSSNVVKFSDVTTQANTTYFYRVRARNSNGDSAYLTEQSVTTPRTVSIWLWNVQHGEGTDGLPANYTRQVNRMKVANDILCTQEQGTGDNGWANAGLTAAGFSQPVYRENDAGQQDGPAIWIKNSRVTLIQFYQHDLSEGAFAPWNGTIVDKAAVGVKVAVDGFQFYVFCTHLAWSAGADAFQSTYSTIRVAQIKELLTWIASIVGSDPNYIIAADFNFQFADYPRKVQFTADSTTDVLTATDHWWVANQPVTVFTDGGTLPSPLAPSTTYYVRDVTTNSLKLSLTPGGAAINLTTNGSGVNYINGLQEDLFTGKGLVHQWSAGVAAGKAIANWGDRDGNGPDQTLSAVITHDTREIDGFKLYQDSTLTLRSIEVVDTRAQCPHGLNGSGQCVPEVVELTGTSGDAGVRDSDHNPMQAIFNLPSDESGASSDPAVWVNAATISVDHTDSASTRTIDPNDTALVSVTHQNTGLSASISVGATNNANI